MRVNLISLGCPKNLVDSEVMLGHLTEAGHAIEDDPARAEAIIVNTCSFIEPAREEAIEVLLEAAEHKRSGSCRALICAGCLPQRYPDELAAELPEVDAFVGLGEFHRIAEVLSGALAGEKPLPITDRTYLYSHETPRQRVTAPWLAYVKIAEGCRHNCAFCAIPSIRGPLQSRPVESVHTECERLVGEGVREINLISQDSSSYGRDSAGPSLLSDLLATLAQIEGDFWLRVLHLSPTGVDDRLLDVMGQHEKIVPYVDIPLQHASRRILKAMRRPGSAESCLRLIERIRSRLPGAAIRSTFLLGFPGETEEDFQALLEFLEEARLDRVTGFTFSREEGTPAATMKGQVPAAVAEDRLFRMMDLQQDISAENQRRFLGQELRILVEEQQPRAVLVGRSVRDAPEIDGSVIATGEGRPGEFVRVKITEADEHDLYGSVVGDSAPVSRSSRHSIGATT